MNYSWAKKYFHLILLVKPCAVKNALFEPYPLKTQKEFQAKFCEKSLQDKVLLLFYPFFQAASGAVAKTLEQVLTSTWTNIQVKTLNCFLLAAILLPAFLHTPYTDLHPLAENFPYLCTTNISGFWSDKSNSRVEFMWYLKQSFLAV